MFARRNFVLSDVRSKEKRIIMVQIDDRLVHRLVSAKFPQWSQLAVRPVARSDWDNRTFHLGEEMLVRC